MASKKTVVSADVILQLYRKTAEEWESENPIIEEGEPTLVLDKNRKTVGMKIGDGVTPWNQLEYFSSSEVADKKYNPESENAQSGIAVEEALQGALGDIEAVLDRIIAIQNELIGGDIV